VLTDHLKNIINRIVHECNEGEYDKLASSDKGTDNQGHSFEDKVVAAICDEFGLSETTYTPKTKRELFGDIGTSSAIIYDGGHCSDCNPVWLVRLPKGVDLTLIYEGKHLPIELKSSNSDAPKFNAGLNDGDRVRDEVILFHSRKSRYIALVRGDELLPKEASDAFDEIERRIRVVMAESSEEFADVIEGFKLEYPRRQELKGKQELFKPNPEIFARALDFMCQRFK